MSTTTSQSASQPASDPTPSIPTQPVTTPSVLNKPKKKVITVMLIGETGSGKTSFMSLLVNLFLGRRVEQLKDENNPSKESGLAKFESQTSEATLYTVTYTDGTDKREIRILDTPGLADTRGLKQDKIHKDKINTAIKDHVTSLDAVIIMTNGSLERLSTVTNYTLLSIAAMFPHSILDNIGFVFTNSDIYTWNFDMNALEGELPKSRYWLLQNPLPFWKKHQQLAAKPGISPMQVGIGLKKAKDVYGESVITINDWLQWLDERKPQPTVEINNFYQMSVTLESKISGALSDLTELTKARTEWNSIDFEAKNNHQAKEALKKTKELQTQPTWNRQDSEKHNTLCIASNCYSNCHISCGLDFLSDTTGEQLARNCASFITRPEPRGPSTLCLESGCGHPASDHRHYRHLYVLKPQEMNPKTKEALEKAETIEAKLEISKADAERRLKEIQGGIVRARKEIQDLVEEYNKVALNKNFVGHIWSVIRLLKMRREDLAKKANTDTEIKVIDESIKAFEDRLDLLGVSAEKEEEPQKQTMMGSVRSFFTGH